MIQVYHHIVHYNLGKTYYKMPVSKKVKKIDNKTEQNKTQKDLDRQTDKV